jgi:hypothetical protein
LGGDFCLCSRLPLAASSIDLSLLIVRDGRIKSAESGGNAKATEDLTHKSKKGIILPSKVVVRTVVIRKFKRGMKMGGG